MTIRMVHRRTVVALAATATGVALLTPMAIAAATSSNHGGAYEPVLDPANFVSAIDNPYYPLPVGRLLVYKGVRDGQLQIDKVRVTDKTRVIEGITATTVSDIAKTPDGTLLEKTRDWYAQDNEGTVWYLGEDTASYGSSGQIDTSGSWLAGVNDGEPGIIMEANPRIPDAYRQEYLKGEAEDTAWITGRGGQVTIPYGTVGPVLKSLEHTALEPNVVDLKVYAPGLGIVKEKALAGDQEVAKLVRVRG
ncbi:MAG TPA: hypothetical protein VMT88_13195 [Actinomycetes bacterium]|nr:hypothetical protein [Actinomycetes bacterium]